MKKIIASIMVSCCSLTVAAISLSAISLGWFSGNNAKTDDQNINGRVGLRSYFYDGDGGDGTTPGAGKPFEIVSPNHFYNLTRLQNLGAFPTNTYFQLGHYFTAEELEDAGQIGLEAGIYCINSDGTYGKYLDMGDFSNDNVVLPIGGEGAPFNGVFNGNGLSIKNLTVSGNPEDVGVFGYISSEGYVHSLVFEDLNIVSLGYENTTYDLYNPNLDDILSPDISDLSKNMKLDFYDGLGNGRVKKPLKSENGLTGYIFPSINNASHLIQGTTFYKGYFDYTEPDDDSFTYTWKSSSPIITTANIDRDGDGNTEESIVIDFAPLRDSVSEDPEIAGTEQDYTFNSGNEVRMEVRLSLLASQPYSGFVFTRVIQSYCIEFYSNKTKYEDGGYSMIIACDYVDSGGDDAYTNYHHGNNVGLIAGHLDGRMENCYCFNGAISFNKTGYNAISSETDTGLVGEVGSNVFNSADPKEVVSGDGDTGLINFTSIYNLIRNDMTATGGPYSLLCGKTYTIAESPTDTMVEHNYISYDPFINEDTIGLYEDYLRYDSYGNNRIIKTSTEMGGYGGTYTITNSSSIKNTDWNSVDFKWNQVIEENEDKTRQLGIFKIVTSNCPPARNDPTTYWLNKIGGSRILNGKPKNKVYFSTAEYDEVKGGGFNAFRPTTIPSSSVSSFEYPFSKDYNYCFELDLSQADLPEATGNNYMWNVKGFLREYLKTVLINQINIPIESGPDFGFKFTLPDAETEETYHISSLSSYMPVGCLKDNDTENIKGDGTYYPPNSIVFGMDNKYGGNVSVVGNGSDITIYKFNTQSQSKPVALYSMKAANANELDKFRYFTYDYISGAVGTTTVDSEVTSRQEIVIKDNDNEMKDNGALYAHIFKLPKLEDGWMYAIGSRSGTANIYYLRVQGQEHGNINSSTFSAFIGSYIENVDFITKAPNYDSTSPNYNPYPFNSYRSYFNFSANLNLNRGVLNVGTYQEAGNNYMVISFKESDGFIKYILAKSYEPHGNYKFKILSTVNPTGDSELRYPFA